MSVQQMLDVISEFEAERDAILGDDSRTNDWKRSQVADVHRRTQRMATSAAESLWGTPTNGKLEGGLLWRQLEGRRNAVRAARDVADPLDPVKVQLAAQRLGGVLWRLQTVADVAKWHDTQATSYEARALQLAGAGPLRDRFGSGQDVFTLLGDLERAYQAEMQTPDVTGAEARLEEHYQTMEAAYEVTRQASNVFTVGGFSTFGEPTLSRIVGGVRRVGHDTWERGDLGGVVISDATAEAWANTFGGNPR